MVNWKIRMYSDNISFNMEPRSVQTWINYQSLSGVEDDYLYRRNYMQAIVLASVNLFITFYYCKY